MGIYHLSTYLPICLIIYQSISIYYLSLSSICYLLFYYLSLLIIYYLLSITINDLITIIYLLLSIIWLFSLSLYDTEMSHHVLLKGGADAQVWRHQVGRNPPWAKPRLSCGPGGSVGVSGLVQDGPPRPGSHNAACWVCRVGCVRATASSTLLLRLAFSPSAS